MKILMDPIAEVQVIPCNECQAGVMHKHYITYFTWLGEELITVPNFPAWVCDVCGKREYDHQAEIWLQTLLKPEAGKPTVKNRKTNHKPPRPLRPPLSDQKG
jgi:YgiT-type zinc finger domain-containing protein